MRRVVRDGPRDEDRQEPPCVGLCRPFAVDTERGGKSSWSGRSVPIVRAASLMSASTSSGGRLETIYTVAPSGVKLRRIASLQCQFRRHAQKPICGVGLHVDPVEDRPGWPPALEWYAFNFSAEMGGEK